MIDEAEREFNDKVVGFKKNSFHMGLLKTGCGSEVGNIIVDFELLGQCDMGVVTHSGFGMVGVLKKENKNFKNFFVYTDPVSMKKDYWSRENQSFHSFDPSLFYLEF